RAVVGVDRLWRHVPLLAIRPGADLVDVVVVVVFAGRFHVREPVARFDRQAAPVTPFAFVGVTDLGQEQLPFFQRFLLGGVAHPVQILDVGLECVTYVGNQFFGAFF